MRYFCLCLFLFSIFIFTSCVGEKQTEIEKFDTQQQTIDYSIKEKHGKYSGRLSDNLPNGKGSFSSLDFTYTGNWENGFIEGIGTATYNNKVVIKGSFSKNMPNGECEIYNTGVKIYSGCLKDGKYDGDGKLCNNLGEMIFEGDFKAGYIFETKKHKKERTDVLYEGTEVFDFLECAKSTKDYIGKKVYLKAKLYDNWVGYNADDSLLDAVFYIGNKDEGQCVSVIYNYSLGEEEIQYEKDYCIYGTITGTFTYTTSDGKSYTIPILESYKIINVLAK